MLDVLIIGGGPHALTLASLLSSPDPEPDSDHEGDPPFSTSSSSSDPLRSQAGPENSKNKLVTGRRKRRTTAGQMMEEVNTSSEWAAPPSLIVLVVDTYGEWTGLWESQFTALNIPHLRSHTLVHTDPLNKNSLEEFALKHDRSDELHSLPEQIYILDENAFFNDMRLGKKEKKRLNIKSSLKKTLSLSLPGTKLSVDFFKDQVERYKLDKILQKGTVEQIVPVTEETPKEREEDTSDTPIMDTGSKEGGSRRRVKYFQVHLQDGKILKARRVVMATGPTRAQMSNIPMWVKHIAEMYPEERLQHTVRLMHQKPNFKQNLKETNGQKQSKDLFSGVCEAGQRVMVVGGGLTSAHVVSLALQQGAGQVTWVMRKHLQLKQFDVGDVESLVGRYSHVEHGIKMDGQAYLRQFYNERSLHKRLTMIRRARKGGAITPEAYVHLQPFIQNGQVELKTFCQVNEASWCYRTQTWNLSLSSGDRWTGDTIWLATGCKLDVRQDPLLSEVMREFPIQVIDGWPCITDGLKWTEDCPLYLMGQYSALQVGPHAVNLAGGQAASMRISKDIIHHQIQNSGLVSDMKGGKSKTEEYIQQMQGLFWL